MKYSDVGTHYTKTVGTRSLHSEIIVQSCVTPQYIHYSGSGVMHACLYIYGDILFSWLFAQCISTSLFHVDFTLVNVMIRIVLCLKVVHFHILDDLQPKHSVWENHYNSGKS